MSADNLVSAAAGTSTTMLAMITGFIQTSGIIEVTVYGIIGGAAGYLGKKAIQKLYALISNFYHYKSIKSNQNNQKDET